MAFNNTNTAMQSNPYGPQSFSPYYNPITPLIPQGMVWAKGKNEALNYPMARGTTLPIFDSSEEGIFYIKTVDVYGNTQPLREFKYEEVLNGEEVTQNQEPSVPVEEFNALKEQMASLQEEIKKLSHNNDQKKMPYRKENRNNG